MEPTTVGWKFSHHLLPDWKERQCWKLVESSTMFRSRFRRKSTVSPLFSNVINNHSIPSSLSILCPTWLGVERISSVFRPSTHEEFPTPVLLQIHNYAKRHIVRILEIFSMSLSLITLTIIRSTHDRSGSRRLQDRQGKSKGGVENPHHWKSTASSHLEQRHSVWKSP